MLFATLGIITTLLLGSTAVTAAPRPLVPDGWQAVGEPGQGARTFVSPDGTARLRVGHVAARSRNTPTEMNGIAYKDGERVTYQRRGDSWIAVSGFRAGDIFYRKANLACGGTRWNVVEFQYPREAKRQMDAAVTATAHDMGSYRDDCR